jgi:hypothetical protein
MRGPGQPTGFAPIDPHAWHTSPIVRFANYRGVLRSNLLVERSIRRKFGFREPVARHNIVDSPFFDLTRNCYNDQCSMRPIGEPQQRSIHRQPHIFCPSRWTARVQERLRVLPRSLTGALAIGDQLRVRRRLGRGRGAPCSLKRSSHPVFVPGKRKSRTGSSRGALNVDSSRSTSDTG